MNDELRQLQALSWPARQLGQALVALADESGRQHTAQESEGPLPWLSADMLNRWLRAAAARLGLEVEPVTTTYGRLDDLLRHAGPAILRLPDPSGERYLLLIAGRWQRFAPPLPATLRID